MIQVEPPFLLLTQKDKRRLCLQGDLTFARIFFFWPKPVVPYLYLVIVYSLAFFLMLRTVSEDFSRNETREL